jgi:hypothetical protein
LTFNIFFVFFAILLAWAFPEEVKVKELKEVVKFCELATGIAMAEMN